MAKLLNLGFLEASPFAFFLACHCRLSIELPVRKSGSLLCRPSKASPSTPADAPSFSTDGLTRSRVNAVGQFANVENRHQFAIVSELVTAMTMTFLLALPACSSRTGNKASPKSLQEG